MLYLLNKIDVSLLLFKQQDAVQGDILKCDAMGVLGHLQPSLWRLTWAEDFQCAKNTWQMKIQVQFIQRWYSILFEGEIIPHEVKRQT